MQSLEVSRTGVLMFENLHWRLLKVSFLFLCEPLRLAPEKERVWSLIIA